TFFILGPEEKLPDYIKEEYEEVVLPDELPAPSEPKMATLYIGKGKKDKIAKTDIVGFLCKIGGLQSSEIGKIDVKDRYSYVAIKKRKISSVITNTKDKKIKGIRTILEEIR
ncbi:MAG: DbpA RNA binding domain-containing protein, partial [Prevotella bivia]|nr:DbpA RNA binding domain-containing protein [Prevotella bivia]